MKMNQLSKEVINFRYDRERIDFLKDHRVKKPRGQIIQ